MFLLVCFRLILMQVLYETVGGAAKGSLYDLINMFNIFSCSSCSDSNQLVNIKSQLPFPAQTMKKLAQHPAAPPAVLLQRYSTTGEQQHALVLTFLHISDFLFIFSEFRSKDVYFLNRQKEKKKVKIRNLIFSLSFKII